MNEKEASRISLVTLIIIIFFWGFFSVEFRFFPYPQLANQLRDLHIAIDSVKNHYVIYRQLIWAKNDYKDAGAGVVTYEKAKSWDGLTLYSSPDELSLYLINMDGSPVYKWHMDVADNVATGLFYGEPHLFDNGDILTMHTILLRGSDSKTDLIGGIVKLDKDSNVLWHYPQGAHHDLELASDGTIYTLMHELRETKIEGAPHWDVPFVEDQIAILGADGQELKRISIPEIMAKSPKFKEFSDFVTADRRWDLKASLWFNRDITHANAIRLVNEEWAQHYEGTGIKVGDVLLSFREPDALVVINVEEERVVWAIRGFWRAQHDPELLPNGNILIFDNEGRRGAEGNSRIVEYNPRTTEFEWSYSGTPDDPFYSFIQGGQSVLPNGNILISDTMSGRILEVTREGETVWEFINPAQSGDYVALTHGAQRFQKSALPFLNNLE